MIQLQLGDVFLFQMDPTGGFLKNPSPALGEAAVARNRIAVEGESVADPSDSVKKTWMKPSKAAHRDTVCICLGFFTDLYLFNF